MSALGKSNLITVTILVIMNVGDRQRERAETQGKAKRKYSPGQRLTEVNGGQARINAKRIFQLFIFTQ